MAEPEKLIACIGCGAPVPDSHGPTHPYIGASPGCWAVFGEVLAKEYGEYGYPAVHRLTVDTYAVQHPGTPSRQSIQSVAVHLIGLYLALERGREPHVITEALGRAVQRGRSEFVWLEPPASQGSVTVLDIVRAGDLAEHQALVGHWARLVWAAWAAHHATVRSWAER